MLHLAKSAAWREDFEFAVELMRSYLAEGMYGSCKKEHFPMDVVVDKCVGMGEMGVQLVEQVLEWHRMMKVNLTKNMADSIIKWIQRWSVAINGFGVSIYHSCWIQRII